MRKSGLTGDEAYILSKHGKTTEDLGPLKKEIGKLKEDLAIVNNVEKIIFIKGGYIATNGKKIEKTVVKDNIMSYAIIDCSKDDYFTINGTGGSAPRLWCFVDTDGNVKAVARSKANEINRIIKAPVDGCLIINNATDKPCFKGRILDYSSNEKQINTLEDVTVIDTYDGWIKTNENSVDIFNIIDDTTYKYSVVSCKTGEWFTITAVGANAPRAWCFTDELFNVIHKSDSNISVYKKQMQAPSDGYLIINDNSDSLSFKGRIWENEHFDFSEIRTSYSNGFAFPSTEKTNFIDGLTLSANSISGFDIPSTEFKKQLSNSYSHVSTLKIVNGIGYVCYLENITEAGDNPNSDYACVKLAIIDDIENPINITKYTVAKRNDVTIDGKNIISGVGEPNIIYKDGIIYIYMSCKLNDNHWHYIMRTFNVSANAFGNIVECNLSINGVSYEFSGHTIFDYINNSVNKWTFLSMSAQYATVDNDYYFGVCIDGSLTNGIILKLSNSDFINFEFWLEPSFENKCSCKYESALFELDGYLYNAVRQTGKTELLLAKIKILDKTVEQDVVLPDGNARPTFFKNGRNLYLMHTTNTGRNRTSIETIQYNLNSCYTVLQTTLYVPYPSVEMHNGLLYFTFTDNAIVTVGDKDVKSNSVTLSRFKFGFYNTNDIIGKIRKLLQLIN